MRSALFPSLPVGDFYYGTTIAWVFTFFPLIVGLFFLLLPGFIIGKGLRWPTALTVAFAPIFATGIALIAGITFPLLHLPYYWASVAAFMFCICLPFLGYRFWCRDWLTKEWLKKIGSWRPKDFTLIGVTALMVGAVAYAFRTTIDGPAWFSQSWDSSYHLAAIQAIVRDQNGSFMRMSADYTDPEQFYPAGWHDMVALLVPASDYQVSLATNVFVFLTLILVWPSGLYALAKQLQLPKTSQKLIIALALILPQYPDNLLWFGTLRANFYSLSFIPAILSLSLFLLDRIFTWGQNHQSQLSLCLSSLLGILFGLGTLILTQPGVIFTFLIIAIPLLFGCTIHKIWLLVSQPKLAIAWSALALIVTVLLTALINWLLDTVPRIHHMRLHSLYSPHQPKSKVLSSLINLTFGDPPTSYYVTSNLLVFAILGFIGALIALYTFSYWPLLFGLAVPVVYYYFAITSTGALSSYLTGFWFGNIPRISPLLVVNILLLIALSLGSIIEWFARLMEVLGTRIFTSKPSPAHGLHKPKSSLYFTITSSVCILSVAVAIFSFHSVTQLKKNIANSTYMFQPGQISIAAVDWDKLDLFLWAEKHLPKDAVILGDPFLGGTFSAPVTNRRSFPTRIEEKPFYFEEYLSESFSEPSEKSGVCIHLKRNHINYFYALDPRIIFYGEDYRKMERYYKSLNPSDPEKFGKLLKRVGRNALYQITYCDKK